MDEKYISYEFDKCLAHLIEECGETLAAAGKTLRWGPTAVNPELPECEQESNLLWLLNEMTDLESAIERLRESIEREGIGR